MPLCSVFVLCSPAAPAHSHWSLQCDRYKSIDIEVPISISILLWQSINIGIDDTFKAGIDIEYRQYFWKISITTLIGSHNQQCMIAQELSLSDAKDLGKIPTGSSPTGTPNRSICYSSTLLRIQQHRPRKNGAKRVC